MAESFFATLEPALTVQRGWPTRNDFRHAIFRYIETWYSRGAGTRRSARPSGSLKHEIRSMPAGGMLRVVTMGLPSCIGGHFIVRVGARQRNGRAFAERREPDEG